MIFRRSILFTLLMLFKALSLGEDDLFQTERARLQEDNPAVFTEAYGATLWNDVSGPIKSSLKACDVGLGPGQIIGAYAELPRWFPDVGQVMDAEQRLAWCRRELQGFDGKASWQSGAHRYDDLTALTTWLAAQSRGRPIPTRVLHPEEQRVFAFGEEIFFKRAGSHDYACATCHRETGRRIRLQVLPNLLNQAELKSVVTSWPAYRISQGETRTLRWRIFDCLRQQHIEGVPYESEIITALELYLMARAGGGVMNAPSLKR